MNSVRYWRTGAVAVVMAALGQESHAARRGLAEQQPRSCRQSPFDVADTALRIEGSARRRGMPVFARGLRGASFRFIVLASAQGGTPVLMHQDAPDHIQLPLGVLIRQAAGGRAEVLSDIVSHWLAMPQALALDLAELDAAVADALRG